MTTLTNTEKHNRLLVAKKLNDLLIDEIDEMEEINLLMIELLEEIASNPRNEHYYEAVEVLEDIDAIQSEK